MGVCKDKYFILPPVPEKSNYLSAMERRVKSVQEILDSMVKREPFNPR
jgi:hypothetical protein